MDETIDSETKHALPKAEIQVLRGIGAQGGVRLDERGASAGLWQIHRRVRRRWRGRRRQVGPEIRPEGIRRDGSGGRRGAAAGGIWNCPPVSTQVSPVFRKIRMVGRRAVEPWTSTPSPRVSGARTRH